MKSVSIPIYSSLPTTSPVLASRRSVFRLRERYILLLSFIVLCALCYGGFMFLPDVSMVPRIRSAIWKLPRPDELVVLKVGRYRNASFHHRPHGLDSAKDPHKEEDRQKLWGKINQEDIIPQIPMPIDADAQKNFIPSASTGLPSDTLESSVRKQKIKEMMLHAWNGYVSYAWGANELRPQSKTAHSGSVFGNGKLGASIIDAMDTLYIMGLKDEFERGKKWVELTFDIKSAYGDLSVFETNIRFVGGLLSCYGLTKDKMFLNKAVEVADTLLPAFDTPTGIPYAMFNAKTGRAKNWSWASGGASILSEFGTLSLEFEYLSAATGNKVYQSKIERIFNHLKQMDRPDGLFPNYLNPKTGKWGSKHVSMGALGDSFYEYLLKSWLITSKSDKASKDLYDSAMQAFEDQELIRRSDNGLVYFAELRGTRVDQKMDHLACFVGGLLALQSANEDDTEAKEKHLNLAKEITHTCHESYIRSATHLGPESFRFTNEIEARAVNDRDKYYILRPEVIEAYFYLWRVTKDNKYREWAWDAAQAIEKHCKADAGYAGIRNVYESKATQDDVQQSFFLAETLKYLYLTFSDDSVMPLDKWVFNTEAHPLPVRFSANQDVHVGSPQVPPPKKNEEDF